MENLKSSKEYAKEVAKIGSSVDLVEIDTLYSTMSANYAYKNTRRGQLEAERATYISGLLQMNEKMSVAKAKMEWESTAHGIKLLKLKREVESLKQLLKVMDSKAFSLRQEASLLTK